MGSNTSISLSREEIDHLSKETGFTNGQIKRLHTRFLVIDKDNSGYLLKKDLLRIPELNNNPVRERIIDVLVNDYGTDDRLNFKQFANVLAIFRRKSGASNNHGVNNLDNKLKFIFDIYDRDRDNLINKHELLSILNMIICADLPNEQMNAIAERTFIELGLAPDDGITFEKFCECLKKIDIDDKMSMKFLS